MQPVPAPLPPFDRESFLDAQRRIAARPGGSPRWPYLMALLTALFLMGVLNFMLSMLFLPPVVALLQVLVRKLV